MDRIRGAHSPIADAPLPLPRAFWALPIVVLAAWFPIAPYWASDDFFALHWAKDFGNVLHDFTGAWYGAEDLFFFYRPLITLSLWIELQLAGAHPFLAHFDNALVHACSALLVACIWRRFLSPSTAFAAGLVFGLSPSHIGAIGWAIARTDGFSCALALLSCLLFLRHREGRCSRAPSLVAFGLALLCKETVLPMPALVFVLACAHAREGSVAQRVRSAIGAALPHAAVLLLYLAWRLSILTRLGGYDAAAYDAGPMAAGLAHYVLDLANPLRWTPPLATALPGWSIALAFAPLLLGIIRTAKKGLAAIAAPIAWFLLASVPMAGFFAQADNAHNLRYFCVAFAALCGVIAMSGRVGIAIAVLSALASLACVRMEQLDADMQSRTMHEQLIAQHERGAPQPRFVGGMPHQSKNGVALQLHFGIDRLLEPPFSTGGAKLFAHRPTFSLPGAVDLTQPDGMPLALPQGSTYALLGSDALADVATVAIAELPLECADTIDCTSPALYRLNDGTAPVRIRMPGVRTQALRVTFFTASGYLGALAPNHAPQDSKDGLLDLLTLFQQAQGAPGRELIRGLEPSTIMDLDPSFPVLIEGGTFDPATGAFTPTHRARRMVTFRFDRGLPKVMRGGK